MHLALKRVYDPKAESDGKRILVDRLWPRGLTKQEAAVDVWAKDVAPSTELRRWYHADMDAWQEFRTRYMAELRDNGTALAALGAEIGEAPATLLFSAHVEPEHSHAAVLRDYLLKHK